MTVDEIGHYIRSLECLAEKIAALPISKEMKDSWTAAHTFDIEGQYFTITVGDVREARRLLSCYRVFIMPPL